MEKTKDRFEIEIDKWMVETDNVIMTLEPTYERPGQRREKDSEIRLVQHKDGTYSVFRAFMMGGGGCLEEVAVSVDIDRLNMKETLEGLMRNAYL